MDLIQAKTAKDWQLCTRFLQQAVHRCIQRGLPLWTYEQVSLDALKKAYGTEQLFLLRDNQQYVGSVFIHEGADEFWPEYPDDSSVYFHKFVIGEEFVAHGLGHKALSAVKLHAQQRNARWLRCDCHAGRPRLRAFYESFGFQFVDEVVVHGFDAARYQIDLMSD